MMEEFEPLRQSLKEEQKSLKPGYDDWIDLLLLKKQYNGRYLFFIFTSRSADNDVIKPLTLLALSWVRVCKVHIMWRFLIICMSV